MKHNIRTVQESAFYTPAYDLQFPAGVQTQQVAEDSTFLTDCLGLLTRRLYYRNAVWPANHTDTSFGLYDLLRPGYNGEILEWIDLLKSIDGAKKKFRMIELGCGYGRWLARAHRLAKARGLEVALIGVEGEPTRFRWLQQHLHDNSIPANDYRLVQAAVSERSGAADFYSGSTSTWYGQSLYSNTQNLAPLSFSTLLQRLSRRARLTRTQAVTLSEILRSTGPVDLLTMDIQGAELSVIREAAELINSHVKSIHIETHSREQEGELRSIFYRLGWQENSFVPCNTKVDTEVAPIGFLDGVLSCANPQFKTKSEDLAPWEGPKATPRRIPASS